MGERPKRIKAPEIEGWEQLAIAMREAATAVVEQMRESFGPLREVRLVTDPEIRAAKALRDTLAEKRGEVPTYFETEAAREQRLVSEIRARVLLLSGYREEDQPTAGDVAQNELATERTGVVMDLLEAAMHHSYPEALGFPRKGAPLHELLNALRPLVYRIVNATADNDASLTDNVDVIMAFVSLAREHADPKRLLPRGDRLGDWLPPGTAVSVFGKHPGVVAPEPDRVLVQMNGYPHPVSFPRTAIAKEGEPWTPPKHTGS